MMNTEKKKWKPEHLRTSRIIPDRLAYWAKTTPDAHFLRCGSPWLTFAETHQKVEEIAGGLASIGVSKGDRVAVMLPNRLEMVLVILSLARLGAIQVPINVYLKGEFLSYQLNDCTAEYIITDKSGQVSIFGLLPSLPTLSHLVLVDDEGIDVDDVTVHLLDDLVSANSPAPKVDLRSTDLVSIMYTSGTTGLPKGCMLSHGYYLAVPWSWYELGLLEEGDVLFSPMPLFHTGAGVIYLMNALQGGLAYHIDTAFSASKTIERVIEADATIFLGVTAHGIALLATPESELDTQHRLRFFQVIPMEEADQLIFEKRFNVPVQSKGYGQTEANPATLCGPEEFGSHRASMGKPTFLYDVSIRDEDDEDVAIGAVGEVCIRPKFPEVMFQGYWGKPEATAEAWKNLWHHTGDLASENEEGYLFFAGRKSDSVRRRGENVSAIEVERSIIKHEGVKEVAVHDVPGELGEDDIKACIVWHDIAPDPLEFFNFLKKNLPYFAMPRYISSVDSLPANATGRVMKYVLKDKVPDHDWDFQALGFEVARTERRG